MSTRTPIADIPPTGEELRRALRVAAAMVERYDGTDYENAAIAVFERLESAYRSHQSQDAAKSRARSLLNSPRSTTAKVPVQPYH